MTPGFLKPSNPPRPFFSVILLGCPKNRVDAERILGTMARAGFRPCSEPAQARVIVVTTCAFLESARQESETAIRRALALKSRQPDRRVVVFGCLVRHSGHKLARRFPAVDFWLGLDRIRDLPALLAGSSPPARTRTESGPRLLSTPRHYAYLRIADGCDNRCAYCLIPSIRGPLRSRPVSDIVAEARTLADSGVRELILIAQDTTAYGNDSRTGTTLAGLLDRLSRIPGIDWLRLMYAHPAHLGEDVLDQLASNPKLCRYIDLPIQHVSNRILQAMNRHYTRADLELCLEQLHAVPDIHIRTTVITGFPGETQAEFRELLDFVRAARFDRLSGFAFSPEAGTPAAKLPGQVPAGIRAARLRHIMHEQASVSRRNLRRLVGREIEVIVDSPG
ncbi:MAG: 30S ribosomal protein S12 methylthiotransferase RimO, partial [candidate division WOR-3 bacterium]